jgi:hypothetical protein
VKFSGMHWLTFAKASTRLGRRDEEGRLSFLRRAVQQTKIHQGGLWGRALLLDDWGCAAITCRDVLSVQLNPLSADVLPLTIHLTGGAREKPQHSGTPCTSKLRSASLDGQVPRKKTND